MQWLHQTTVELARATAAFNTYCSLLMTDFEYLGKIGRHREIFVNFQRIHQDDLDQCTTGCVHVCTCTMIQMLYVATSCDCCMMLIAEIPGGGTPAGVDRRRYKRTARMSTGTRPSRRCAVKNQEEEPSPKCMKKSPASEVITLSLLVNIAHAFL